MFIVDCSESAGVFKAGLSVTMEFLINNTPRLGTVDGQFYPSLGRYTGNC